MKPPARNKKAPSNFEFDASHVLDSARVSKHRKKMQVKIKKREARKVDEPNPGENNPTDEAAGAAAAVGSTADTEAAIDSNNESTKTNSNQK